MARTIAVSDDVYELLKKFKLPGESFSGVIRRGLKGRGNPLRLFDTTFVVDLVNDDPGAVRLAKAVDEESSLAALSVVSVHEYLFGVHFRYLRDKTLSGRLSSARRDLARFEIIPLTQDVVELSAGVHAELARAGRLIGINDVYIAATALKFGMTVVSRNEAHFGRVKSLRTESY
ncbi:MAG: PIN domain-containing protein [Thaumarchaeota archaeon]|nr:MAG: PIN domain-containing protein [Nitrososphaerota archaeon]